MDKKINDKLKKAKDLITLGQPEEALDLLHTVLMSDSRNGPALMMRARCEMSLKRFPEAEASFLKGREFGFDGPQLRAGLLQLYRVWTDFPDKGLNISLFVLNDVKEEGNQEKIRKTFRDFLYFCSLTPHTLIERIVKKENLYTILEDSAALMRVDSGDEEYHEFFVRVFELVTAKGLLEEAKIEKLFHGQVTKVAHKQTKDALLDAYLASKEAMASSKLVFEVITEGRSSPFFGLPAFSIFCFKHGVGLDDFGDHLQNILALFTNKKEFLKVRYRSDVIFYLREMNEFAKKINELLRESLPCLSEDLLLLLDRNQTDLKIDLSKKNLPDFMKALLKVLNRAVNDDSINFLIKRMKDYSNSTKFELTKLVLVASVLTHGDSDQLNRMVTQTELWISAQDYSSEFQYKLLMFLLDSEDLFGTQPKINIKEHINRISASLENENHSKFLTCELYWNNLDINKQTSIKDTAGVILQTLEQLAAVQKEYFTERRVLVYKNRLIALSILEKGEESLETAFQQLIELNLREAENNLSQQNIAVVSIILGKAGETSYLINKIIESENLHDESLAKVCLAFNSRNQELLDKLRESFDSKYWYVVSRGLYSFKIGDYSKAYNFLLNGLKRLEGMRKETHSKPRQTRKNVITLTKLKSGRYESKVLFSPEFICKNFPTFFFEELPEDTQADIILNIKFLIAICNKFLQKPFPANSLLLDILESLKDVEAEPLAGQECPVNAIVEEIGQQFLGDAPKQQYLEVKAGLMSQELAKYCYGELAVISLYTEKNVESLVYAMLYSNFKNPSFNILFEVLIGLWDQFDERLRVAVQGKLEELVDICYAHFEAAYPQVLGDQVRFEAYQQMAFLGSFLEYKLRRPSARCKFLGKLEGYTQLLAHTEQTDNNVLTYNLGVLNENEENPLCAHFSLNYNAWMQYYLKLSQTASIQHKISALLISINLNFDNQMCWNLLGRFMLKNGFFKFGLQALNMAKVFKIGQDKRETEYLISLWMLILGKVETQIRLKSTENPQPQEVVAHLKGLLKSLSINHHNFLAGKVQEERDFVIKNSQARVEMTLEGLGKKLSGFHENKNYQLCLKLLLLYSLKVDRLANAATKSREIGEIVSLLKDPHFFKEVIYCSKELFATLKGDDLKKAETDCLGLLGLVAGWFVAEEMKPHRGLLQDSLLNSIADLVATDFQDVPQSLVYLKRGKRTVASDNLKSLVFQLLVLKSGRRLGTEALCSLLGLAKRCILENPASSTCRSLYNDILLYSGSFGGLIFPYNEDGKSMPALFGCDLRLFDMFKANKLPCPTYHARTTAAKVAILQRPDLPFMKKTAEFLLLNEKAKAQKKSLDSERVAAFCRKEKNRLLASVFGKKDAAEENVLFPTSRLWEETPSRSFEALQALKQIAAIDNMHFLLLLSNPPQSLQKQQLGKLVLGLSKIILGNTRIDQVYYFSFLHFLYIEKNIEELQSWVEIFSYLRISPEAEFFVNYSLLLRIVKDIQAKQTEAEDEKETLAELFQYFESDCYLSELKNSAKFVQIMSSKLLLKDIGQLEFAKSAKQLVERDPEWYGPVLSKYVST